MATLDDRVRDVLRVKFLVGLFDRPYITDAKQTLALVNSAAHQRVALVSGAREHRAAEERSKRCRSANRSSRLR